VDDLPARLALHPARPSPFAGRTTFAVDVPPGAGRVHLAIYSAAGRLVRSLADAELDPGSCEFVWDGSDDRGMASAAGVYFARCECDLGSVGRKLVLMR
jgi:flagellar hook assembly protein FlgD